MKRIQRKLCSQSGVSILLALLFLLLCGMIGASVLAAAASNAGRVSSSKKEQQKYFALSSALQLVYERLAAAEYTAKATVNEVEVIHPVDPADPANYTYKIYEQKTGEFRITTGSGDDLTDVLPMVTELDKLFAKTFPEPKPADTPPTGGGHRLGDHIYKTLSGNDVSDPKEHVLVVKLDDLAGAPALDEDIKGLKEPVKVTVRLGKDPTDAYYEYYKYWFFVTAELKDDEGNVMQAKAELSPRYSPVSGLPPHINNVAGVSGNDISYTVTWKKERIDKK